MSAARRGPPRFRPAACHTGRVRQQTDLVHVATRRGLNDVTDLVRERLRASGLRDGLATVFVRHTSASLVIQENADPAARRDLEAFNLLQTRHEVEEDVLSGPAFRTPTLVQPPRVVRAGLRLDF